MTMPAAIDSYPRLKASNPETILIFKVDDRYESYHEDAIELAESLRLDIATTGELKTASFPESDLESHLSTLLQGGKRAAVCEQVK